MDHTVAERKNWAKFGQEKGNKPGPDRATTTVGENVSLKLSAGNKVSGLLNLLSLRRRACGEKECMHMRELGSFIGRKSYAVALLVSQWPPLRFALAVLIASTTIC